MSYYLPDSLKRSGRFSGSLRFFPPPDPPLAAPPFPRARTSPPLPEKAAAAGRCHCDLNPLCGFTDKVLFWLLGWFEAPPWSHRGFSSWRAGRKRKTDSPARSAHFGCT